MTRVHEDHVIQQELSHKHCTEHSFLVINSDHAYFFTD